MKRAWSLVFTAGLAAASLWLYYHAGRQETAIVGDTRLPDLSITQPQWELFDEQGRLQRSLRAEQLQQWPGEQGSHLLEPKMDMHTRNNDHVRITASEGWIYADDRPILLEKRVILERPSKNGHERLLVKTERLEIDKSGNTARTEAPVMLQSGRWLLTSLGMRADLNEHRAEFLNRVRGIHE